MILSIQTETQEKTMHFLHMRQKLFATMFVVVLILSGCGNDIKLNPFSDKAAQEKGFKILPQPLPTNLYVNGTVQLQVKANVDGEIREDILSMVNCFAEDKSILEVVPNSSCLLRGLKPGNSNVTFWVWPRDIVDKYSPDPVKVNIRVLPAYVIELVISGSEKIYVNSTQSLSLSALMSNGKTVMDARGIARCLPVTSDSGILLVRADCTVTAGNETGPAKVTAELIVRQTAIVQPPEFTLTVVPEFVSETVPFSIADDEFSFYYRFVTDVYSSYKIMMVMDEVLVESVANKVLLTTVPTDTNHAVNTPCFNELASGNQAVACGVDTAGTAGFIDIFVDVSSGGLSGKLELTEDRDILMNDNQGVDIPESLNDYTLMQVGSSYEGHVSSNAAPSAANESRYYTNVNNGLLQNASNYQVAVTFLADDEGAFHFDTNNVKIGWVFDDVKAKPIKYSDATTCIMQGDDTVLCNITGGQDDLFVFIYGNGDEYGANEYNASPATADGELSYTVLINNVQ